MASQLHRRVVRTSDWPPLDDRPEMHRRAARVGTVARSERIARATRSTGLGSRPPLTSSRSVVDDGLTPHRSVVHEAASQSTGAARPESSSALRFRPEIRRDYPLNLSILLSGGRETNEDSLSNGE